MSINQQDDPFKKINRVEAPAFLMTRIRERLNHVSELTAPANWKWAFVLSVFLILFVNATILITAIKKPDISTQKLVDAMQLNPSNDLYHE